MYSPYQMNYSNFFPQQNPYQNFQPGPQIQGVKFVNGLPEANNWTIPPGTKALFMDKNEDKFYLKETDFNNFSTVTEYEFYKTSDKPLQNNNDFITREEFERWKEQYESTVQSKQSKSNDSTSRVHKNNHTAASKGPSGGNVADQQSLFE